MIDYQPTLDRLKDHLSWSPDYLTLIETQEMNALAQRIASCATDAMTLRHVGAHPIVEMAALRKVNELLDEFDRWQKLNEKRENNARNN